MANDNSYYSGRRKRKMWKTNAAKSQNRAHSTSATETTGLQPAILIPKNNY